MSRMQDILESLRRMVGREDRLFTVYDLRGLFLSESDSSFYPVLSRLVSKGWLIRVCRGVYMLPDCELRGGELLGRTAAVLRARYFNYLSLETVLSESGVISQIPMGRIMVMSSGRSNVISCGDYGTIEFLHTSKSPDRLSGSLVYDSRYHLWRATVCQAIQDMRDTQRDMGLIDWEVVDEFV